MNAYAQPPPKLAAAIPGAEVKESDVTAIEVVLGQKNHAVRKVTVTDAAPSPAPSPTPSAKTAAQNICKK